MNGGSLSVKSSDDKNFDLFGFGVSELRAFGKARDRMAGMRNEMIVLTVGWREAGKARIGSKGQIEFEPF